MLSLYKHEQERTFGRSRPPSSPIAITETREAKEHVGIGSMDVGVIVLTLVMMGLFGGAERRAGLHRRAHKAHCKHQHQ